MESGNLSASRCAMMSGLAELGFSYEVIGREFGYPGRIVAKVHRGESREAIIEIEDGLKGVYNGE